MAKSLIEHFEVVQTLRDGTPRYSTTVPLSGIDYRMEFDWNSRDSHWYCSIFTNEGEPVKGFMSRKLVVNWPVSQYSTDPNQPFGYLYNYSAKHDDPVLDTLGGDVLMLFVSPE